MWPLLLSAAFAGQVYALGDVVRLRAAPDTHAEVTARAPIGTPLEVHGSRGAWLQVTVADRPPAHALTGWVRSDLVAADPITLDGLLDRASGPEGAVWHDRAAAFDPGDPRVIAARGAPSEVWLAQCHAGRVWGLGVSDAAGFHDGALDRAGDAVPEATLRTRAAQLGAVAWYTEEGRTAPGRFAAPFLVPRTDIFESDGTPWSPGASESPPDAVVLGPCRPDEEDRVFATMPLRALPVATPRPAVAPALPDGVGPVAAALVRDAPDGGREARIEAETGIPSCGGDEGRGQGLFWAWADPGAPTPAPLFVEMTPDGRADRAFARWFAVNGQHVGFVSGHGLTTITFVVRAGPGGAADVTPVVIRMYGC